MRGWHGMEPAAWMGGLPMMMPGPWRPRMGGCGRGPLGFWRRFATRQERIEWLQAYLEELRREAKAVEELIEELRRQGPAADGASDAA